MTRNQFTDAIFISRDTRVDLIPWTYYFTARHLFCLVASLYIHRLERLPEILQTLNAIYFH